MKNEMKIIRSEKVGKGNNFINILEVENINVYLQEIKQEYEAGNIWDYPIEEINYLIDEHRGETFIKLKNNRLIEYVI